MRETSLIYSKNVKERNHLKNVNVDGRVFYNESYKNQVRRFQLVLSGSDWGPMYAVFYELVTVGD
jgi:hypothetical protein